MTVTKRIVRLDADALATLEEQRAFLQRSLEDLEYEHDAGDLESDDYETLKHDYEQRLASVDRTITEGKAEFAATRAPVNRGRKWLTVTAVVVFALACGFMVARSTGRRDAGGTITGEISRTARERNTECLNLALSKPDDAINCYSSVLGDAPDNVEALTYRGWVRINTNDPQGLTDLRRAVMTDGTYPDVHTFLAVVLFRTGCISDAKAELDRLDGLHPPVLITQIIDSLGLRQQIETALSTPSTTANICG